MTDERASSAAIDLDQALACAMRAADRADALLKEQDERRRKDGQAVLGVTTKSSPWDYVTAVDALVQGEVIAILRSAFPAFRFVAEETGAEELGEPDCPYEWIIDPLDGTNNFIHGKPNFGTMIALRARGELLLGVLSRPLFGERFEGRKGTGARINGAPVKLRATKGLHDAIVVMSFHGRGSSPDGSNVVRIPGCASVENYGNAAEAYAQVLLGRNDGVLYPRVCPWDAAAGCFLIAEAGGSVRLDTIEDGPRGHYACVAATKPIFEELKAFLG